MDLKANALNLLDASFGVIILSFKLIDLKLDKLPKVFGKNCNKFLSKFSSSSVFRFPM